MANGLRINSRTLSVVDRDHVMHVLDRDLDAARRSLQEGLFVPCARLLDLEIRFNSGSEDRRIFDEARQHIKTLLWRQSWRRTVVRDEMNERPPRIGLLGDDGLHRSGSSDSKAW